MSVPVHEDSRFRGNDRKIRIAGAGPSGLAAAIVLKKHGFDVEVHEARPVVGGRWKKGFQILENISEKADILELIRSFGIQTEFQYHPVHRVTLWDGKHKQASFDSQIPLGYYVQRGAKEHQLDGSLLAQAQRLGVRVVFNSRRERKDVDIAATGPRRIDGMGKEVTFQTSLSDRMTVILDPQLAPGGYSYLFVCGGEATLGVAILDNYKKVDPLFEQTVERFQQIENVKIENGEEAHLYANFFMPPTRQVDGVVVSGEASGFQDYLFGFGIRYAIQSGALAARSLIENVPYDILWKRDMERKQKVGLFNRFLYEKCQAWLPSVFIGMAVKSPDFRGYMRSWYDSNPVKLLTADILRKTWKRKDIEFKNDKSEATLNFNG